MHTKNDGEQVDA